MCTHPQQFLQASLHNFAPIAPTPLLLCLLLCLLPVNQLLSAAFNIAWVCSLFNAFTPLACPLSTVNFLKSELNRPWKGGTDGYILGGNYQPLPPNTHTKKETSEGVAFRSTDAADMFVGSLAASSNRHTGKGLLESRQHVDSVTGQVQP